LSNRFRIPTTGERERFVLARVKARSNTTGKLE
jgi:hypothetical protein